MVGLIFMLVVCDLRLLSRFSMDVYILYIKLKLNIRAISWCKSCVFFNKDLLLN